MRLKLRWAAWLVPVTFIVVAWSFISRSTPSELVIISGIIQLFLMALGAIVSVAPEWSKSQRNAIVATFIIVGGVGFVATIQQAQKSSAESATAQEKLSNALANLAKSTDAIVSEQKLNAVLQGRLVSATDRIASLANENIGAVTGGGAYCYVAFTQEKNGLIPVVIHEGKYTMFDVQIRIVNPSGPAATSMREQFAPDAMFDLPTLPSGLASAFSDRPLNLDPNTLRHSRNIFIFARNGSWSQRVLFYKVNTGWAIAIRLRTNSGKVIMERVGKDFPRNEQGRVDWEK